MSVLDRATNGLGHPLAPQARTALRNYLRAPSPTGWQAIHSLIIDRQGTTVWQAVLAVDPTFPAAGPSWNTAGRVTDWSRVPDAVLLLRALHRALDAVS